MIIKNKNRWALIALSAAAIGAFAHWNNLLSPIHEFGHFMYYEDRGLVIAVHWDSITVKKNSPIGLTKGFSFEAALFSTIFCISLFFNVPALSGFVVGAFISTYFYAHHSTDFAEFSIMVAGKLPPSYIHDWWDKYYSVFAIICLIAFFRFITKNKFIE